MTFRTRRFQSPAIFGKAAGGGVAFSLVYSSSASSALSTTSINYGTLAYSAGATAVVVAISGYASGAVTGVTVGGTSLAQIAGAAATANGVYNDVWQSTGALAGSSGAVVVTFAAGPNYVTSVALYSLTTTTPTFSALNSAGYVATTTASVSLNIPAGGGAIAFVCESNPGAGITASWTNAATDAIGNSGATAAQYYGHTTTTGAATSVTATWSGSTSGAITVVAWAP